ncbi:MAG: hypothetical protein ACPGTU_03885 [Myxococcota bacterium]
MWLLLFIQVCLAAAPAPLQLTPDEEKLVASGELVVRDGGSGKITAIVDLPVSNQIVMEEILNLQARVKEVSSIQDLHMYKREADTLGAKWTVGMMGIESQFHVLYTFDYASGWITFRMDESRANELKAAAGSYQTYRSNGKTRLIYRCDASPQSAVPDWMREMLTGRAMRQQIDGIDRRSRERKTKTP